MAAWPLWVAGLLTLAILLSGCFPPARLASQPQNGETALDEESRRSRFSTRPPINTTRNIYEGSLWRGAASWGNLMRDHRARYRGDLVTITELSKIINVPEPVPEQQAEQAQQQQAEQGQPQQAPVDPIIAFLREQEKRRERIEQEQNEILRSIDQIEVEVVRVLANGNLLVRGIHPPIFRDRNLVKYVVTLQGIISPTDVDDNNVVPAPKLSKAEYKIRRLVRRRLVPRQAGDVARAAGRGRDAEFLDRLSTFLTRPGSTTAAPTR
jgi:flagellar basal body L-ring protein FlgH